jgi:hypothetical protein
LRAVCESRNGDHDEQGGSAHEADHAVNDKPVAGRLLQPANRPHTISRQNERKKDA